MNRKEKRRLIREAIKKGDVDVYAQKIALSIIDDMIVMLFSVLRQNKISEQRANKIIKDLENKVIETWGNK